VGRVTFDLRGPGSLDEDGARRVADWLEADRSIAGVSTLAAKIRAALDWEPKTRRPIPLNSTERTALLAVLETAFANGNLDGDLRWLQQSLLGVTDSDAR
jgi:hypothetical protein